MRLFFVSQRARSLCRVQRSATEVSPSDEKAQLLNSEHRFEKSVMRVITRSLVIIRLQASVFFTVSITVSTHKFGVKTNSCGREKIKRKFWFNRN